MKNVFGTGLLTVALGLGLITTASARSCSEQGSLCKGWARANLSGPQQSAALLFAARKSQGVSPAARAVRNTSSASI